VEECSEPIIIFSLIPHGSIRADAVFEAEELPAGIADLDAALTDVQVDDLSHLYL
jgi:hypothetical protein